MKKIIPYYAVDAHVEGLAGHIDAAISACMQNPGDQVHALIDAAFDPDLRTTLFNEPNTRDHLLCLYEGTPLAGLEECAPFLWTLQRADVADLLQRCDRRPMLSFIQGPLHLRQLQQHLSRFIRARTPDGLQFPLRLADTMALKDIVAVLGKTVESEVTSGFFAWQLIERDGSLRTWRGTAKAGDADARSPPASTFSVDISDAQFSQMVDSGEADLLVCEAVAWAPRLALEHSAVLLHSNAVREIRAMDAAGVKNPQERLAWLLQAFTREGSTS